MGGSFVINESLKTKGKTEYLLYHKTNPIVAGSLHEFRSTGTRTAILPHLLTEDGKQLDVFDQSVILDTTFDVPYTFHIVVNYCDTTLNPAVNKQTYTILTKEIPAGATRVTLVPEMASGIPTQPLKPVYVVPELRLPIPSFTLIFAFNAAPTTGELKIAVARRF